MAFCKNCGKQIDDSAVICPHCGVAQEKLSTASSEDTGSFGWGLLGFCIPIVGLILFLVWKDSKPKNAKIAGKGALIAVIIEVVIYAIMAIAGISLFSMM